MPRDQRGNASGLPLGSALDIEPFLQGDLRHQNEHDDAGLSGLAAIAGGKLVKNPFTGEMVKQKPRPASRTVRVRPMKSIKDML